MLCFVTLIVADEGEPFGRRFSKNEIELVMGIAIGRIDDTEILRSVVAVFPMGKQEHILAFAGLANLRHSLLKMPFYGFAVTIHPQRVSAICKDTIVWRGGRGVVLWWLVISPATKENYRHDGQ